MPKGRKNFEIDGPGPNAEGFWKLYFLGVFEMLVAGVGLGFYSLEFIVKDVGAAVGVMTLTAVFSFIFLLIKLQSNCVKALRKKKEQAGDNSAVVSADIAQQCGEFWAVYLPCSDFGMHMRTFFIFIARLIPLALTWVYVAMVWKSLADLILDKDVSPSKAMGIKTGFVLIFTLLQLVLGKFETTSQILALVGGVVIFGYAVAYPILLSRVWLSDEGAKLKVINFEPLISGKDDFGTKFLAIGGCAAKLFGTSSFMAYYLIYEQRQTKINRKQTHTGKALFTAGLLMFAAFVIVLCLGVPIFGKDKRRFSYEKIPFFYAKFPALETYSWAKDAILILMAVNIITSITFMLKACLQVLGPKCSYTSEWIGSCVKGSKKEKSKRRNAVGADNPVFDFLAPSKLSTTPNDTDVSDSDEPNITEIRDRGCPRGSGDAVLVLLMSLCIFIPADLSISISWVLTVVVMPFMQGIVHVFAWINLCRKEEGSIRPLRWAWVIVVGYLLFISVFGGIECVHDMMISVNKFPKTFEYKFYTGRSSTETHELVF